MAHWLLQHNPARGDCGLGDGDWPVRRYRDRVTAGDDVAVWVSGKRGGVVAVGKVVDPPHPGADGPVMGVAITKAFHEAPVPRDTLKADPRFAEALVLRMPGGGNPFPVTPGEWRAIVDHVPGLPEHQFVAKTVRTAAAAGATALREAVRSVGSQ